MPLSLPCTIVCQLINKEIFEVRNFGNSRVPKDGHAKQDGKRVIVYCCGDDRGAEILLNPVYVDSLENLLDTTS